MAYMSVMKRIKEWRRKSSPSLCSATFSGRTSLLHFGNSEMSRAHSSRQPHLASKRSDHLFYLILFCLINFFLHDGDIQNLFLSAYVCLSSDTKTLPTPATTAAVSKNVSKPFWSNYSQACLAVRFSDMNQKWDWERSKLLDISSFAGHWDWKWLIEMFGMTEPPLFQQIREMRLHKLQPNCSQIHA